MKEAGRDYKTQEMRAKGKDLWAKIARNKKNEAQRVSSNKQCKEKGNRERGGQCARWTEPRLLGQGREEV